MHSSWNGIPVPFYDSVEYSCNPGYFFSAGRDVTSMSLKCMHNGYFDFSDISLCFKGEF